MASPAAVLNILLTANTAQATAALAKTEGQLTATGKTATVTSATMKKAMLGAGAAVVGLGVEAYKLGKAFDSAYDKIQTRTGATGKQLDKLEGSFKKVLTSVPTSFGDAADAVAGLNQRLGLTGKPLTKLSRQVTALSKVTGTDVQENVESLTRLFGDWSVKTDDQTKTLDKLFRASQDTGISVSDLARSMVQFGSPLRQLGIDFDHAAAMFSEFEQAGVNTQTLMPGLRFAIKAFSGAVAATTTDLKKWGISMDDPQKALQQVMQLIKDAPNNLKANAIAFEVFGQRAGPDMAAAIREGHFEFDSLIKTIDNGQNTIRSSERQTRDFSEQWTLFKNQLAVIVEPVASGFFKLVGEGMKAINKLDLKGIIQSLKDFWQSAGLARDIVKKVWSAITTIFQGGVQTIRGIVKVISGILTGDFGRAWDGVKDIFSGAIKGLLGMLKGLTAPFRAIVGRIGEGLADAFSAAWDKVKDIFRGARDALVSIINWIISHVINNIPGVQIDTISTGSSSSGGGGKGSQANPGAGDFNKLYSGGAITKPMAIVGEEAPAHNEWVIATNPKYRMSNLRYWAQAGADLGVPGFAAGGRLHPTSTAGAVGGAAGSVIHGAGYYLNKLAGAPYSSLPGFMQGTGEFVRDKFADYIKQQVTNVSDIVTGGMKTTIGGPTGVGSWMGVPMANWVIESLAYAAHKGVRPQPTSGYRTYAQQAAIYAANPNAAPPGTSQHEFAQYPRGAVDFGGFVDPAAYAAKMAVVHATSDFKWPLLAPIGFSDDGHASGTGHYKGGLAKYVRFLAQGGPMGKAASDIVGRPLPKALQKYNHLWAAHQSPDYSGPTMPVNDIAMLAEFFGMPGITMAQIAHGESGYRPGAWGIDASPTPGVGVTKGYGLWAITSPFNDQIVNRLGGYMQMLNPIKNAIAASKAYASSGLAPWHGTRFLTSTNTHWQGNFGSLVSAAHPDQGGSGGGHSGGGHGPSTTFHGPGSINPLWWQVLNPTVPPGGYPSAWGQAFIKHLKLPEKQRLAIQDAGHATQMLSDMINTATTIAGFSYSPSGEDLSPDERANLIGLEQAYIGNLYDRQAKLQKGLKWLNSASPLRPKLLNQLATINGVGDGSIASAFDVLYKLQNPNSDQPVVSTDTSQLPDNSADQIALLKQLLTEANQRTAVSQLQYGVFKDYAGMFAMGGKIGAGQWGIAGENGPEVVTGPAQVYTPGQVGGFGATVVVNGDIINTPPGVAPVEINGARAVVQQGSRGLGRRPLASSRGL